MTAKRSLYVGQATLALALIFASTSPVLAAWRLILATEMVKVGKSDLAVTPQQNWNRWTSRPSPVGEIWTLDGIRLNELSFFAGVAKGDSLYFDQGLSEKPVPTFDPAMLQTDIVSFFESSNRLVLQSSQFEIKKVEPAKFAGHDGVRFSYRYAAQGDGVMRIGEAVAAKVDEKLYLINFVAPEIYYFARDIASVRELIASAKIVKEPEEE
jgi:hypothetical protein